jgi:AraC-like DNA-binding protein
MLHAGRRRLMLQSRVFTFADPDAFQEKVRATDSTILSLGRGEFHAELTQVDFDRLWIQQGSDNLPRISRTTIDKRRAVVHFVADMQAPATRLGGLDVLPDRLTVYGMGATSIARTETSYSWGALSLTHADLAAAGETIAGRTIVCPSDNHLLRPPPALLQQLRALHAQATNLARTAPETLRIPAVAKALEQHLIHTMVSCLTARTPTERRRRPGQHARIVNRFLEFLEARRDEPVYLAEICASIGASERTLRTCCQEVLGVGPVRYLWLRRMHLARQALLHADALATTVTEVATAHGFWELGRFSVEYRGLFGELPSESLRRKIAA